MFCKNCGNKLEDDAKFCASCGTPVEAPEAPTPETPEPQPATETPTYSQPAEPIASAPASEPQTPAPAKPSNKPLILTLSIVGGLAACAGAYFLVKALITPSSSNSNEQQTIANVISGTKTITFGKYSVEIPSDYRYEVDTEHFDQLTIADRNKGVTVFITAQDDEYDDYEDAKERTLKAAQGSSLYYDDITVETKQENGKEVIYSSAKDVDTGSYDLGAIISLDSIPGYTPSGLTSGYIEFEAYLKDGQIAEEIYKSHILPLINTIKYIGAQSSQANS